MKADWNDAPKYIRTKPSRTGSIRWLIPGMIGIAAALGGLQLIGSAFLQGTVKSLADKRATNKTAPQPTLIKTQQLASEDWDHIVAEQAKRDAEGKSVSRQFEDKATIPHIKQTVFNDKNYAPRGADNVLSFKEPTRHIEEQVFPDKVRVTIVEQKPSMKDQLCWPLKKGSIEHRNCQLDAGLKYRDR